jgi:3-hydroxyisobutyrate dehydrogenase
MDQPINTVGYVGLGIMGGAMAANLLKGGLRVIAWNRTRSKADPLLRQGATWADSPADMARLGPDVICTNVTNTGDVEQVIFGENGIVQGARPGLIIVDHSTISPTATRQFARRLLEKRITLIDAPVSGGDVGARNGTLSIMVGCDDAATVARCRPMLEKVGRSIVHVGASGAGQVCKACNQIAVVCTLLGTCEALALAKKSGLDPRKMIDVVAAGAGGSWQLANLGPKIVGGDYAPGFMVRLVLKDLGIVAEAARELNLPLSGTALAEAYFRAAAAHGHGELGTQAMAKAIEALANLRYDTDRGD